MPPPHLCRNTAACKHSVHHTTEPGIVLHDTNDAYMYYIAHRTSQPTGIPSLLPPLSLTAACVSPRTTKLPPRNTQSLPTHRRFREDGAFRTACRTIISHTMQPRPPPPHKTPTHRPQSIHPLPAGRSDGELRCFARQSTVDEPSVKSIHNATAHRCFGSSAAAAAALVYNVDKFRSFSYAPKYKHIYITYMHACT